MSTRSVSSERDERTPSRTIPQPLQTMSTNTTRSPPSRENVHLRTPSSPQISHRQSFIENLRGNPASPRAQRTPSLTQQALQDLLNNPPVAKENGDPRFAGRDWRSVAVGEVIDPTEVRFVEMDTTVEDATSVLVKSGAPNCVLLRDSRDTSVATGIFDYSDLNAYLLLVVGLAKPDAEHIASFNELARRGLEGKPIPLKDVKDLGTKEPLMMLPESANLTQAVEILGSGVHRIIIIKEDTKHVVGILTQLRLVRFFWENRQNFAAVDPLYARTIGELNIGSHSVISINGDKPLADALELMNRECITSIPVLDNHKNVVGNISHVDVRLLTKSTSLPLLRSSCIQFISVILSERGVENGKDSFPVFHINPVSTLAHAVAKLVATRSHRMWIVTPPSPSSSGPPTPLLTSPPSFFSSPPSATTPAPPNPSSSPILNPVSPAPLQTQPYSVSAASLPGTSMSGRLTGVVSLTDILNLFARASGLTPRDPDVARRFRRRSSSVSVPSARRSTDSVRSESVSSSRGEPSLPRR